MMPADTAMTSIVQRIARQALLTFRSPGGRSFQEQHGKLRNLVAEVRAADLQLVPRRAEDGPGPGPGALPHQPPVTYMHICETEAFSMGVFLLRGGACIPLHDHPGMHGVLKVLYGKVRISCFDRPESAAAPGGAGDAAGGGAPRLPPLLQAAAPRRSVLRSTAVYTEHSPPCVLGPERDNLHQIDAVDGPTAFMDILAPPYDPDDGRDCHYYRVVSGPEGPGPEPREVWLQEVPQPPDFRCGGEPYPGPEVQL